MTTMTKKLILSLIALSSLSNAPALAIGWDTSSGTSGDFGHSTYSTGTQGDPTRSSNQTGKNSRAYLPTHMGSMFSSPVSISPVTGGTRSGRFGLPQTRLDSFVAEAGGHKDAIYGDEGEDGPPPFEEFTREHRIEAGIYGERRQGLSTGHGSYLPSATGGDGYVDGAEMYHSGSSGGWMQFAAGMGRPGGLAPVTIIVPTPPVPPAPAAPPIIPPAVGLQFGF